MGSLGKILDLLLVALPPLGKALGRAIDAFTSRDPKLGPPPERLDLDAERAKVLAKKK